MTLKERLEWLKEDNEKYGDKNLTKKRFWKLSGQVMELTEALHTYGLSKNVYSNIKNNLDDIASDMMLLSEEWDRELDND